MKKIDVAELLRDCPSGMELDCTMFEGVEFDGIVDNEYLPIRCRIKNSDGGYNVYNFTKHGYWNDDCKAKCVIFPKGKTSWEGFQKPFKDGDIIAFDAKGGAQLFIFKEYIYNLGYAKCYMMLDCDGEIDFENGNYYVERLATEEEKEKLFNVIKARGFKWNPETKTLEKLAEPQFKVGDTIKHKTHISKGVVVTEIKDTYYILNDESALPFTFQDKYELVSNQLVKPQFKVGDTITNGKTSITIGYIDDEYYYEISRNIANRLFIKNQDEWNLIPNKFPIKFDINTLVPFESRVLMRSSNAGEWVATFYSHYSNNKFYGCGMCCDQCIPYEGNEHLVGKTDDCDEQFKTWE